MSRKIWIGLLLILGGCVSSLHPLYTEKDLIFDPALLGEWTADDGKATWAFTKNGETQYQLVCADDEGKQGRFQVHLLKIEGRLFLDLFPMDDNDAKDDDFYKLHRVPAHTFMFVKQIQPTLQMAFLDPFQTRDYLKDHPESIRHEKIEHDRIVLTAQPKELQAFVLQHENDLFRKMDPLKRKASTKKP